MTTYHNDYDSIAKKIVDYVGKTIVLGVPLGIGKPIGIINALYRLASSDPSIKLTILTGLTLARPKMHHELQKRFLEPILDRILGDYIDPLYEQARVQQTLPDNIKIIEFFLTPGNYLKNNTVQQNYINANYTDVVHDILNYSINVVAQQITRSNNDPDTYSLSCNSDLFHDMTNHLRALELQGKKIAIIAEINLNLPFMLGDAIIKSSALTDIVDTKHYRSIFAIPKPQLSLQDHLIGLYSSVLIKDNSCLQIGIGKLGDAITHALILRHKENALYQDIFHALHAHDKFNDIITTTGALTPFEQGLYASTEMFSDAYMHLYNEKILKKRVYDHIGLQKLLNSNQITERITPSFLDILLENKIINSTLTQEDIFFLQRFGILHPSILFQSGNLILPSGEKIPADLTSVESKNNIIKKCLGETLKSGKIIHAGFFIGSNEFYNQLKKLSIEELQQIDMTSIARTNTNCWSHELSELQRQHARFINTSMMITVEGAIISDGLKNWQEVSGVGGQFNFAYMAKTLPQARFIINCHSTRYSRGKIYSNIVWDYPNVTLPRYLRDIVITEYGIADCRSKTDSDIIKAILNITDSRFQEKLLKTAKKFGKISPDYQIPNHYQKNYPSELQALTQPFQSRTVFKPYPFGSELTEEEQVLQNALLFLKNCTRFKLFLMIGRALLFFPPDSHYKKYLTRMKLEHPKTLSDFINKKLLTFIISLNISPF